MLGSLQRSCHALVLSNGGKLRLLRDSRSLARSAFVEFDLELIFAEQLFADFVLLFLLVHASRFAVPAGKTPADCWLERWRADAVQMGAGTATGGCRTGHQHTRHRIPPLPAMTGCATTSLARLPVSGCGATINWWLG
jgi:hypothetical protein